MVSSDNEFIASDSESTRESVLVVDDDFDTMDMFARLLRDNGYRVYTAVDREEALDVFSKYEIHTILLDYMMPGMSAIRFLDRVFSIHPATRVILTTAANRVETIARMLGLREYVPKPMDEQQLLEVLQHH